MVLVGSVKGLLDSSEALAKLRCVEGKLAPPDWGG